MSPRKPIRQVSKATAKAEAEAQRTVIQSWLKSVGGRCMFPRCHRAGRDVHEICSGPTRMTCRKEAAGLLYLCREHHDFVQGLQQKEDIDGHTYMVKLGVNLAIKIRSDAKHFDAEKVRRIIHAFAEVFDWEDISHGLEILERSHDD